MIVDRLAYLVAALHVAREAVVALKAETRAAPADPGPEGLVLVYEADELLRLLSEPLEMHLALRGVLMLRPHDRAEIDRLHAVGVGRARSKEG